MRLFIALDITDDIREALREFARRLKPLCSAARWTRPEGQHVTLKFLGEVGEERLEPMRSVLSSVRSPNSVAVDICGTGFFPNARHPRAFWAGVEASPNLAQLAADVEGAMAAVGFGREQREFRPHLTLARFQTPGAARGLTKTLESETPPEFGCVTASEFHIYRSHLKPGGAEYTRIETFPFVEKTS